MRYSYRNFSEPLSTGWFILILVIIFIIYGCISGCEHDAYNNGICTVCGGHMKFIEATSYTRMTKYYYKCEKCNRRITTRFYRPDN